VGKLTGLPVRYATAETVYERYEELFEERRRREERKGRKGLPSKAYRHGNTGKR
jgi:hypothetical protein